MHDSLSTPRSLHPELARRWDEFEDNSKELEALVAGLSDAQINWRPDAGRWSLAECVEHLNRSTELYLSKIDAAIANGREEGRFSNGPYRHGRLGDWFVRSMEPPVRLRLPTPRLFRPSPGKTYPLEPLHGRFREVHRELDKRLSEAHGLDLGRIRLASPVNRFLRLSLGQVFALLAAHERRHLWQARNVREHPSFPTSGREAPAEG